MSGPPAGGAALALGAAQRMSPWAAAAAAVALGLLMGAASGVGLALGIGLAFALALTVLVFWNLFAGLCALVIASFLDGVPIVQSSLFSPSKLVGVMVVLACIREATRRPNVAREVVASRPVLWILSLSLAAWVVLSTVWATSAAATFADAQRLALNLLLVAIVLFVVRERPHAIAIAIVLVAGSVIAALYGLLAGPGPTPDDDVGRLSGTLGDANELATVLVVSLPLSLALAYLAGRRSAWRLLAGLLAVLALVAILQTLSRGGLLALATAGIAGVLLGGRWRLRILAFVLVTAVCIGVYFTQFASADALERVTNPEGGSGRSDLWRVAWRMAESHPLQGVGFGNFTVVSSDYFVEPGLTQRADLVLDKALLAHNTHLQILAELGFVGLALYLGVICYSLRCGLKAASRFYERGDPGLGLLSQSVVLSLVGLLSAFVFLSNVANRIFWVLLALGPALLTLSGRAGAPALDSATTGRDRAAPS